MQAIVDVNVYSPLALWIHRNKRMKPLHMQHMQGDLDDKVAPWQDICGVFQAPKHSNEWLFLTDYAEKRRYVCELKLAMFIN